MRQAVINESAKKTLSGREWKAIGQSPEFGGKVEDAGWYRPAKNAVNVQLGAGDEGNIKNTGIRAERTLWRQFMLKKSNLTAGAQLFGTITARHRPLAGLAGELRVRQPDFLKGQIVDAHWIKRREASR